MAPLRQFFGHPQPFGEISAREWCRNQPSNSSIAALIRTSVTLGPLGDLIHRGNTSYRQTLWSAAHRSMGVLG
jgi:hypothetical protein